MLSRVLTTMAESSSSDITMVALSYRGYWTSGGRASQRGIEKDTEAFLQWAAQTYPSHKLLLWGQSIGAGIAAHAASRYLGNPKNSPTAGMILETPFVSVRRMLAALYPERWVPYKYLWPFLRNWWDSEEALRRISQSGAAVPKILILPADKDEVVPATEADHLEDVCKSLSLPYLRQNVRGALHNEASTKPSGRQAIADFLRSV